MVDMRSNLLAQACFLDRRVATNRGAVDDMMPTDRFPDFITEPVEVVIHCQRDANAPHASP